MKHVASPPRSHAHMPHAGFTLIELLVVIVIIGILASFAAPRFFEQPAKARITAAKTQMLALSDALEMYKLDNHTYPTTEQGLMALVEKPLVSPVPANWKHGGYMRTLPKDPWGKSFIYLSPGLNHDFDIYSFGADGARGGEAENADLNLWDF